MRINRHHNKQKQFYSGKKRRHTLKMQVVVDKETKCVICSTFANDKRYDFVLFTESKIKIITTLDIKAYISYIVQVTKKEDQESKKLISVANINDFRKRFKNPSLLIYS